jgi:hypothetical protein
MRHSFSGEMEMAMKGQGLAFIGVSPTIPGLRPIFELEQLEYNIFPTIWYRCSDPCQKVWAGAVWGTVTSEPTSRSTQPNESIQ